MVIKVSFNWEDFLLLDQQFIEEECMVCDSVQQFVQDKLVLCVFEVFCYEQIDLKIFCEMGEIGLFGVIIFEVYGGSGFNYVCYGLIVCEVECVDFGYCLMMSVQFLLVMVLIYEFGNEVIWQKYLFKLVSGEYIGCFGLIELNYGFDLGLMVIWVKKVDGGYCLSGSKMWIINSLIVDVFVVWVKDDEGQICGFVFEKGWEGLSVLVIYGKVGLCVLIIGEIVMDNVFVLEENVFFEVCGLCGLFICLNLVCYGIFWGVLGVVEFCWYIVCQYVFDCQQFGCLLVVN